MYTKQERRKHALEYFESCSISIIDEFRKKVAEGGILRDACLSCLKEVFKIPKKEGARFLEEWLKVKEEEDGQEKKKKRL